MSVLIDLGTSRTAVAVTSTTDTWVDIPRPNCEPGKSETGWGELERLIKAIGGVDAFFGSVPHLRNYSRFCQIGDLVVPASISGSSVKLPVSATLYPDTRSLAVFSIKQDADLARRFLKAIRLMVEPLTGVGSQWVIGRSSGGIDASRLGLPGGTQTFNEAVAVMFAALGAGLLSDTGDRKYDFAIVADLGGGFLDVAIADNIVYTPTVANANVVNYGGYPLGVDRVAERFDEGKIDGADTLAKLLRLPIEYHLWDYLSKAASDEPRRGCLILTGGGFRRLEKSIQRRRLEQLLTSRLTTQNLTIVWPTDDTKELTLRGLRLLSAADSENYRGDTGRDLSRENPQFYGTQVLAAASIDVGGAITWEGLVDDLRRTVFLQST
jgi:hypothetical protein